MAGLRMTSSGRIESTSSVQADLVSGGIEHSAASVRHPGLVDAEKDRHPSVDAEDVHGCQARLVTPDRSVETAWARRTAGGTEGYLSEKISKTQRERRLQPLAGGIGASERARGQAATNRRRNLK